MGGIAAPIFGLFLCLIPLRYYLVTGTFALPLVTGTLRVPPWALLFPICSVIPTKGGRVHNS